MAASRKQPKRQSKLQSPKRVSAVGPLPDRRAIEGVLSALGGRDPEGALATAQQIMYEAWNKSNPSARIALAHKALAISNECADAYVLLAEAAAKTTEEALEFFRKGVAAGERALGPGGFKEYAGHFWGFLETRPYMRARAGLAGALNALGEVDAAIGHYHDMLRLNPNDNQGIRYLLAQCLMKRGDAKTLKELFKKYDGDRSAVWLYSRALVAFREDAGSGGTADEFLRKALRANKFVLAFLTNNKKTKPPVTGYLTMGGEDEAAHYVEEWGFDWLTTPGAIEWLGKISAETASAQPKRPAKH
jgi:tetratricopeptide (TPR) repeat protein